MWSGVPPTLGLVTHYLAALLVARVNYTLYFRVLTMSSLALLVQGFVGTETVNESLRLSGCGPILPESHHDSILELQ